MLRRAITKEIHVLNQHEWLNRCAQRYISRGGCDETVARHLAEGTFVNRDGDESPEEAADVDMSYWAH
ncbi:hypothetical protein CUJ89_08495 [Burkholderia pyrrocinia]|uniref:Uncharacterized protein n=1 Tax=Burkholderia pyrrocinia TaxID=60550 RepID=A0A2Z5MZK4_BURPY|nr:hypothetical protein CUJ89_08495 [Burkholderia pyrrocinia]